MKCNRYGPNSEREKGREKTTCRNTVSIASSLDDGYIMGGTHTEYAQLI